MTGTEWVVALLLSWVVVGTALAGLATLALTQVRRRLVWDDTLPALEELPGSPVVAGEAEQATA